MIRRLPPAVVNQIAAGEVVERPVSVVKELLENALDAGATRVRIEIDGGGQQRIAVIDDGDGFLPEDLPLAFASHATSKLATVADLDHIGSLGFRGEALASIGAVARAAIRSRRRGEPAGWEVRCDGGVESAPQPCGCPEGTRVEVRDLFFNVPARRRFLKSAGAERARIEELVAELSLARLEVDFTLVADGRERLRLPTGEPLAERFARCFGAELRPGLLVAERAFPGLAVAGVVAEPDLARRDGKLELMFVNGRLARESSALHAIRQAFREYLMGGRFPVYALQVTLPPDQVDANVHPRKAEVRFVEARRVAGCLHETVRSLLQARGIGRAAAAGAAGGVVIADALPRARSGFPELPRDLFGPGPAPSLPRAASPPGFGDEVREPPAAAAAAPAAALPNPFQRVSGRFLQVLDLYLLLEGPDGLLVVDQHALHERVVYERLRREHAARAVQIQRLLVPAVVDVTPSELAWLDDARDGLAAQGLLVEPFGPGAVAVQGLPAVLAKVDPRRLVRDLLAAGAEDGRTAVHERIAERFHSMACRAAVMSGDRLNEAEIAALLAEAATLEHPHNCPHGRPTVLTFGTAELERYFRRRC
ncbi:MAG: DNA mismatch repair endonuclease MutL [Planctomycetes bacterium]|nr:DNA mismatch repair endonuclease MutL [Planctomycetota bacterium]